MTHTWHEPTGYCTRCGILNMNCQRPLECLATPNCHGMMHLLKKRQLQGESVAHGVDYPPIALGTDPHLPPKEPT